MAGRDNAKITAFAANESHLFDTIFPLVLN